MTKQEMIKRAEHMDDKLLNETWKKCRDRVLNGRSIDGLSADDSLRVTGALKLLIEARMNGTATQEEEPRSVLERLLRDVPGLTEEQGLKYLHTYGSPYKRLRDRVLTGQDVASDSGGEGDDGITPPPASKYR